MRLALLLLLALIATGCSGEAGDAAVESRPFWTSDDAWTVEPEAVLRLGVDFGAPEQEFGRLTGALRLDDGRVVVSDAVKSTVSWFDIDGRFLFSRGRPGVGPGEFRWIDKIVRHGDQVLVSDRERRRLTWLSADGELIGTARLPQGPAAGANLAAVYPDGDLLLVLWKGLDRLRSGLGLVGPDSLVFSRVDPEQLDTATELVRLPRTEI